MVLGMKTTAEQQTTIHSGEAYTLWQHLSMKYDLQEILNIFLNFTHDKDFSALMSYGTGALEKEVTKIESKMDQLGIPMPKRPPRSINTPANKEIFRDETMFRTIYLMAQISLSQFQQSLIILMDSQLRDMFVQMQHAQVDLYTKMMAYGRLKGWVHIPPAYKGG